MGKDDLLEQRFNNFLKLLKVKGASDLTIKSYSFDFRTLLNFFSEEAGIKAPIVEDIYSHMSDDFIIYLNECEFKPRTMIRKLQSMSSFFRYLVKRKILSEDPFEGAKSSIKTTKEIPVYLTKEEVKKVMSFHIENIGSASPWKSYVFLRSYLAWSIFLTTGIRVSELMQISTSDIRFDEQTILIRGKGNRQRQVPISSNIIPYLKDYESRRNKKYGPCFYFFVNRFGSALSSASLRKSINETSEKVLGKKISPHKLRHTCATLMVQMGVNLIHIQNILGHSSVAVTQIYAHSEMSSRKEASNLVGKLWE